MKLPTYEDVVAMLPNETNGTTECPLCGDCLVHEHTATEIICYRNGVRYGAKLVDEDDDGALAT